MGNVSFTNINYSTHQRTMFEDDDQAFDEGPNLVRKRKSRTLALPRKAKAEALASKKRQKMKAAASPQKKTGATAPSCDLDKDLVSKLQRRITQVRSYSKKLVTDLQNETRTLEAELARSKDHILRLVTCVCDVQKENETIKSQLERIRAQYDALRDHVHQLLEEANVGKHLSCENWGFNLTSPKKLEGNEMKSLVEFGLDDLDLTIDEISA